MNTQEPRLRTSSEEATLALGRAVGFALTPGLTVLLCGGLGAGKTVLARGIGNALGVPRVKSPSFTLINEYSAAKFTIVHADLYRLEEGGAGELGLEEYREAPFVLLVEWPERWPQAEDEENGVLKISIEADGENGRIFRFSSRGDAASAALQNILEAVQNGKNDSGAGLQPTLD